MIDLGREVLDVTNKISVEVGWTHCVLVRWPEEEDQGVRHHSYKLVPTEAGPGHPWNHLCSFSTDDPSDQWMGNLTEVVQNTLNGSPCGCGRQDASFGRVSPTVIVARSPRGPTARLANRVNYSIRGL